jgi:hypothetical protein
MLVRKYFGAFQIFCLSNGEENGISVMINPYSTQWDNLARKLLKFLKGGAGDYSKFDKRQLSRIMFECLNVIQDYYGYGDKHATHMRSMIFLEIVFSRHVIGDVIYEWFQALPSGNPFTTILNCLYNLMLFRLCWISMSLPIEEFNLNTIVKVVGDDNNYSVSRAFCDVYTEDMLTLHMLNFGAIYTSEDKTTIRTGTRPLNETTFLKRGFKYDEELSRYVAPLELGVILEMVLWTKSSHDSASITRTNVTRALQELAIHGEEVYDRYSDQFRTALYRAHGTFPDQLNYRDCRDAVFSRSYVTEW